MLTFLPVFVFVFLGNFSFVFSFVYVTVVYYAGVSQIATSMPSSFSSSIAIFRS